MSETLLNFELTISPIKSPKSVNKKLGLKQQVYDNLQFYSFKTRLRKIYKAIEFERSRDKSSEFASDFESLETFEIFSLGLMRSKSLQILNLSSTNLPDLNMVRLAQALNKNKCLQSLDLSNNNLTSLSFKYLFRMLKDNHYLHSLNLFNNEIQKESIQDINSMILRNKTLVDLNLNFCGIDSLGCRNLLETLTSNSHFKQIHLSKNSFDSQSFKAVSYILSKTFMKLEKFEFAYNFLDEEALKILKSRMMKFPLEKFMPTITELNLMGNKFMSSEAIKHLKYILERIKGIQVLNLTKTFINYKTFIILSPCFRRVHHTLILSNNIFKDQLPENLSYWSHLKQLNLSRTQITGTSIHNLAKFIRNEKKLQWISLDLSHNGIFNDDCKLLLEALRFNHTLISLNLSDNLIDEAAFEDFTLVSGEWTVKNLNLGQNPFNSHVFLNYILPNHNKSTIRSLSLDNIMLQNNNLMNSYKENKEVPLNNSSIQKLEKLTLKNSFSLGPFIIRNLLAFTELIELNLENSCILNKELLIDFSLYLGMTTKLTTLSLKNLYLGRLQPAEIEVLCKAIPLNKSIVKLDLSKNKLNKQIVHFLKALSHLKTLRVLDLSHNFLDNKKYQIISDLILELPDLEEYNLSDNLISFVTVERLSQNIIQNNEKINLKTLKLSNICFSLDCLISIGRLLEGSTKLKELDLSNNEIVKINTATLCNKPFNTLERLHLTNCKYDPYQYKLLLKLFINHPIKYLDLSGSVFLESNLIQFIKCTASLQYLESLDISYIALKDIEISDLLIRLKNHGSLKSLKLNFLDLKENSSKSLFQLLKNTKSIERIDLSDNKLSPFFFTQLKNGLIENKTLCVLNLRKSRMSDEAFSILIEAFFNNKSLKTLDLRANPFTINSLEKLLHAMNTNSKTGLETLLLSDNHLEKKENTEEFTLVNFSQELKKNTTLKILDLANTFPNKPTEIIHLSEGLRNTVNLKKLDLSNNKLTQSEAIFLSKMILSCSSLETLSVSKNPFGIQGIKMLLMNLDKNLSLKELDISGTLSTEEEGDELCVYLHGILIKFDTLQLINISENFVGEKGNKVLVNTLKVNRTVYFINRHWLKIRNELASQVLDALIRTYKNTKRLEDLNEELKHINFSNGKLDDDFCIYFSHHIHEYIYLESLNISDNKKITLIGLKFIFVYLKFNVRLKRIYFKEYSHDSALNNGISTSLIHWSKYTHYDSRIMRFVQKLTNVFFTKMQIIPNRFQYNDSFDRFFAPIKDIYIFLFFLMNFIIQNFLAIFLPIYYVIHECGEGQNWNSHIIYGCYLLITLCFELVFWLTTKYRLETNIVEKDLKREVFLNDILNLFGGVLLRFDIYTDVCFITIAVECETSRIFLASLIVVLIKIFVRTIENLRTLYKLVIKMKKKQKMDCLNLYAKLCCYQSFVITNDIMDRYCPGNAKKIKHILYKKLHHSIYLNIFILDSLLKFSLEDIPQTILQSLFLFYNKNQFGKEENYTNRSNWIIWFSVLKNCFSLIGSFYSMVSIRPSYIEQSDFDETLTVQKLFEGKNTSESTRGSLMKKILTIDLKQRSLVGFQKISSGLTNLNSSVVIGKGVNRKSTNKDSRNENFDNAEEIESDINLEISEDVSFDKQEKLKYFTTINDEGYNFMDNHGIGLVASHSEENPILIDK